MKTAEISRLSSLSENPSMEEISSGLDKIRDRLIIDTINWNNFDYKPDVKVAIAYGDNEIYAKYFVTENFFKAEKTLPNEMVCEDSCVEFFVSPEDDGIYYNLEFNAIGTCLLGTGYDRSTSRRADPSVIQKIRRLTSSGSTPVSETTGTHTWTITLAIPFEVFFRHKIKDVKGKTFRANFYKCGDKLTVPHYVTWSPVGTQNPDYHQPEYFGILKFI
jgi:hypothetical protein